MNSSIPQNLTQCAFDFDAISDQTTSDHIVQVYRPLPSQKQCDTCHEVKPRAAFGRNRQHRDNKQTWCKACTPQRRKNKKPIPTPDQTKECKACHEEKLLADFSSDGGSRLRFGVRSICKSCEMGYRKEHNQPHVPGKYKRSAWNAEKGRASKLRKKFNLTTAQYDEMFARQNGVCALCGKPETARTRNKKAVRPLAIDHCHVNGNVRELLCQNCNMMLGFAKDDTELLRRAADYVERHR